MHPNIFVCTAGILVRNKSLMMAKRFRPEIAEQHNKWYFPGGKLEYGESLQECIRREFSEEFCINFRIIKQLKTYDFRSKGTNHQIILVPFIGISLEEPIPNEKTGNSAIYFAKALDFASLTEEIMAKGITDKIFWEAWRYVYLESRDNY